jgi:hypothetical protein
MTDPNPTPQPERRPAPPPQEQRPAYDVHIEEHGVVAEVVQAASHVAEAGVGAYIGAKMAGVGKVPPPPPPPSDAGPKVILPPGAYS